MIRLEVTIPASQERVWAELADLRAHAEWMADAAEIAFEGGLRSGLGTRMEAATRIGPFRMADQMVVVEWVEGTAIGVDHLGTVSGSGRFHLERVPGGTRLTWTEDLKFPRWLGGPIGAWLATPVLRRIWRSNLARFEERVLNSP